MCKPHETAFLPPDVCRRKERKARKKKRKKSKNQPHSNRVSLPLSSLSNHRIIELNQPSDHLSTSHLIIFSSSFIEKSHDLDAELELGLFKRKKEVSNNQQPSLSIRGARNKKKKLTFHRTTIMSTLQIRADFLLHNRFGSAETTCPTRTRFLHHYPDTNKHISSLIRLINLYEGDILFFWTYPRSSRSTIGNSRGSPL